MLLSGDEMGRTQLGNNNAYCHDSALSWLDWGRRDTYADLWRFLALLIRFRKRHAVLRQRRFLTNDTAHPPALIWHGCHLGQPDWSWESRTLALHLLGGKTRRRYLCHRQRPLGAAHFCPAIALCGKALVSQH